jgi:hypothetical protein
MTSPLASHPDSHFATSWLIVIGASDTEWTSNDHSVIGAPCPIGPTCSIRHPRPSLDIANDLKGGIDAGVFQGSGEQLILEPLGLATDAPGWLSVRIHGDAQSFLPFAGMNAVFCY